MRASVTLLPCHGLYDRLFRLENANMGLLSPNKSTSDKQVGGVELLFEIVIWAVLGVFPLKTRAGGYRAFFRFFFPLGMLQWSSTVVSLSGTGEYFTKKSSIPVLG